MSGDAQPFKRRWTSRKIARIADMRAKGWSSAQMARELGDGTTAASIRHQLKRWKLPLVVRGERNLMCSMSARGAAQVVVAARKAGLTPAQWIGKVAECAARGDLFNAIVDDGR